MTDRRDPLSPAEDEWLDHMLGKAAPIEPSAALRRAVAEIPLRNPQPASAPRELGLAWPAWAMRFALLVVLASAAAGAWLGTRLEVLPEIAFSEEARASDDTWDELETLAFAGDLEAELGP